MVNLCCKFVNSWSVLFFFFFNKKKKKRKETLPTPHYQVTCELGLKLIVAHRVIKYTSSSIFLSLKNIFRKNILFQKESDFFFLRRIMLTNSLCIRLRSKEKKKKIFFFFFTYPSYKKIWHLCRKEKT